MTKKSESRRMTVVARKNAALADEMVTDAKLGIAAVAIESMAAQAGLTGRGLVAHLVALYYPVEMASFVRRAGAKGVSQTPTARLVATLGKYGYRWDEPTASFVKD